MMVTKIAQPIQSGCGQLHQTRDGSPSAVIDRQGPSDIIRREKRQWENIAVSTAARRDQTASETLEKATEICP